MLNDKMKKIGVVILSLSMLLGLLSVCVAASKGNDGEPDGSTAPGQSAGTEDPDAVEDAQDGQESTDAPEDGGEDDVPPEEPETEYIPPVIKGAVGIHTGYATGYDDGSFRPDMTVTRSEAASLLYRLIDEPGDERAELSDVPETAYYKDAVGYLAAIGALDVSESGTIAPDEPLTRGELAAMIVRLMLGPNTAVSQDESLDESDGQGEAEGEAETVTGDDIPFTFVDVPEDHPYAAQIALAAKMGLIIGTGDGIFEPDRPVTRAEAVTVLNRLLGAAPDKDYLAGLYFSQFSDVFATHWAYYDIIEASLSHTHGEDGGWTAGDTSSLKRPEGVYFNGLDFYYIGPDGAPIRDGYSGYLYFGSDGLYTSGDELIDGYVKDVLGQITTPEMTSLEKLRAAYVYTRDSFTYLTRNYYSTGATGWDIKEATTMFTTKRGNCYCYAAVFELLARQLGYDALAVAGRCSPDNPHGWVEIVMDGTRYMFDTELEMAHRKQGRNTDLYMIPWNELPWSYWR